MHDVLHWSLPVLVAFTLSHLPAGAESTQPEQPEKFELNKQIYFTNRSITARVSLVQLKIGGQVKPAWCYQTYGMGELKHPELFVLVLKESGEADDAFPHGPIKILGGLAKARSSEPYNQLDLTPYPCFPELPKFPGVLFVPYDQLRGPQVPSGSLALVAITTQEMQTSQVAGPTRVKAALAQQATYYPCPIWCDRQRTSVFTEADVSYMKKDPTTHLPPVGTYGGVLLHNDDEFSLRISKDEGKMLGQALEKYKGGMRLLLCFDPRAGAFKVWPPEDAKGVTAVAPGQPDASRVSGSFVAIVAGTKKNSVRQFSDGFLLQLSELDIKNLITALATGSAYSADVSDDAKKFSLLWVIESFHNPIDGRDYKSSNGWVTYSPRGEKKENRQQTAAGKNVAINHFVLLTSDDILSRAITVDSLVKYTKALEKVSIAELAKMHPVNKQTVTVQCDLAPGGIAEFKIGVSPSEDGIGPAVKALYDGLNATEAPGCKHGIAFQLVIDVPGSVADRN